MRGLLILMVAGAIAHGAPALDYQFFKERVQPIFLKKRPGHARCVTCHEHGSPPLQPLAAGATTWNEEQSRKNFAMWKLFVIPGDPAKSKLLLHPLADRRAATAFTRVGNTGNRRTIRSGRRWPPGSAAKR